jgi:hypothetical protein
MKDEQYETVAILAKLIQRGRLFDNGSGKVMAVPVEIIASTLEKFTSNKSRPIMVKTGQRII